MDSNLSGRARFRHFLIALAKGRRVARSLGLNVAFIVASYWIIFLILIVDAEAAAAIFTTIIFLYVLLLWVLGKEEGNEYQNVSTSDASKQYTQTHTQRRPASKRSESQADRKNSQGAFDDLAEFSPLAYCGYKAGKSGLSTAERRKKLNEAINIDLPDIFPDSVRNEWGPPRSRQRLERLVSHLLWLADVRGNAPVAVKHWQQDADYMIRSYRELP